MYGTQTNKEKKKNQKKVLHFLLISGISNLCVNYEYGYQDKHPSN